jgi:DNA polymerase elongation subunit (family B)
VPEQEEVLNKNIGQEKSDLFMRRFEREISEMAAAKQGAEIWGMAVEQFYSKKAALHAEFGKIIAISIGKMVTEKIELTLDEQSKKQKPHETIDKFYIRSLTGRDEAMLLKQAADSFARAGGTLVGHNALEFDFPYLMRRYMINGLPIPPQLNVAGLKPWDVKLEDTMKMWSGTQWSHKVSLELLCHVLGIPSPKQDISGADVAQIYWDSFKAVEGELPFDTEQKAMKRIGDYCNQDVKAVANAYCRMKGLPLIENVEYV